MLHQKSQIVNRRRISQSEIRNSAAAESEGGPRRRNFVSLRGKQKFLLFACPVASRRICYGARPSVRFRFCRAKRGNQSWFCSKKVRAAFSNCDQSKLNDFSGRDDCSLAPPSAGLASQKPFCLAIKSNGRRRPTRTCLESRRRFGIAKQFTNEICIQFFPVPLRCTTKPVFNPALYLSAS